MSRTGKNFSLTKKTKFEELQLWKIIRSFKTVTSKSIDKK